MKHVLITGSTRGIGFGLAQRFIEANLKVTINGTSQSSVQIALKKLKDIYPTAVLQGFSCNVSNFEEVELLWENAIKDFGPIDIWINNAGIDQARKYIWEMNASEISQIININIAGVINGSSIAFRKMNSLDGGQIFNMEGFGSDGMLMKKMTLYGTTKRGVRYFTHSLAKEATQTKVLVGSLSPGMVLTDILLNSLKSNPDEAESNKRIFNILADKVDTVTPFLCRKMLANTKNNTHIAWLTKGKVMGRFIRSVFIKRKIL
jgi:NAD(P)-dependent dehydrogenase (short-subunit alcohol dehydrogenase family)